MHEQQGVFCNYENHGISSKIRNAGKKRYWAETVGWPNRRKKQKGGALGSTRALARFSGL